MFSLKWYILVLLGIYFHSGDFYCLQKLHLEELDFMALNCLVLKTVFFPVGFFF